MGDVEDIGTDDIGNVDQDLGQAFGVISLIDIGDITLLFLGCPGITDIVDIEAERLSQIVKPLKL
jgi:hypothetical protein